MSNAPRDNNQNPVLLGVSNADGSTVTPIMADPDDHTIEANVGDDGSDLSAGPDALRDDNGVPILIAVSSDDGVTPVPIYVDPATGQVLIKST